MNSLTHSIIEAEAHLHRAAFSAPWSVFSKSITWFKIKRDYNFIEREHFRKCWESS
jgi:hypothetical protein